MLSCVQPVLKLKSPTYKTQITIYKIYKVKNSHWVFFFFLSGREVLLTPRFSVVDSH